MNETCILKGENLMDTTAIISVFAAIFLVVFVLSILKTHYHHSSFDCDHNDSERNHSDWSDSGWGNASWGDAGGGDSGGGGGGE
jgi:uncharacterized membrane protein YgcG